MFMVALPRLARPDCLVNPPEGIGRRQWLEDELIGHISLDLFSWSGRTDGVARTTFGNGRPPAGEDPSKYAEVVVTDGGGVRLYKANLSYIDGQSDEHVLMPALVVRLTMDVIEIASRISRLVEYGALGCSVWR